LKLPNIINSRLIKVMLMLNTIMDSVLRKVLVFPLTFFELQDFMDQPQIKAINWPTFTVHVVLMRAREFQQILFEWQAIYDFGLTPSSQVINLVQGAVLNKIMRFGLAND
jgi:hypothetical protein